ncbi:hypothetical protein [Pseudoxanthomonas sacheonensis]|uniref:DUF805 domain-containing protein n=1 Tax=Pseudoxanthomonas sacheonensis TaxID=443615 RepID=A0ABU1RR15_9GAMM|nr:hypothetical protein [Pseudoxanthomonas sacheonensis]MDR6841210.1 hypothetical protein [Pseudoxanthomonas sacheonensis]
MPALSVKWVKPSGWFGRMLLSIDTANHNYKCKLHLIRSWMIEFDETGCPWREIGLDEDGAIVVVGPMENRMLTATRLFLAQMGMAATLLLALYISMLLNYSDNDNEGSILILSYFYLITIRALILLIPTMALSVAVKIFPKSSITSFLAGAICLNLIALIWFEYPAIMDKELIGVVQKLISYNIAWAIIFFASLLIVGGRNMNSSPK